MAEAHHIEVFFTKIPKLRSPTALLRRYRAFVPAGDVKRLERIKSPDALCRTVEGELLLRSVLGRKLGVPPGSLRFSLTEHGKPYLKESPEICFNLTHSGNIAACAVGDISLGIDIELIRTAREAVARRFFSPGETELYRAARGKTRDLLFYRIWTMKEAYLKAEGCGFTRSLTSFDVTALPEYKLVSAIYRSDYSLSICSKGDFTVSYHPQHHIRALTQLF